MDAVLKALDAVTVTQDVKAVKTAIRSVYTSWMEASARYLQEEVYEHGYPEK